jgi:hypothetical protein
VPPHILLVGAVSFGLPSPSDTGSAQLLLGNSAFVLMMVPTVTPISATSGLFCYP